MKRIRWPYVLILLTLLAACTPGGGGILSGNQPTKPAPQVFITPAPDARAAVEAFLNAWNADDFVSMYQMIDGTSQAAIAEADFVKRYQEAMVTMSEYELTYEIGPIQTSVASAQVDVQITYRTALIGDLVRNLSFRLTRDGAAWRITWDESLVMPELRGGNRLYMDYRTPERGDIFDRQGDPLVEQTKAYALGLVPGQIQFGQEERLLIELFNLTGLRPDTIRSYYQFAQPDWYVAVGEVEAAQVDRVYTYLSGFGGLVLSPYTARYYYRGGLASQSIGYTLSISPEDLDAYRRSGYSGAERVGYSGVEKWGEEYLGGRRGGTLYVVNPGGQILSILGDSPEAPAADVYLTIDDDLQYAAEQAILGFNGAIVVLERDTGRVLAIVSSPGFDPNYFEPSNRNSAELGNLLASAGQPLYNRATQGTYPLGSVFKVITYSTALETGAYTPDTTYNCQYEFTELNDRVRYDWTWDHCQDEFRTDGVCTTQPSGLLTLSEGLMRSCNPYFWHIALDLPERGYTAAIADMARAFGLGQATGIQQVAESAGQIDNPPDAIEAVNQAIGQGTVLVTPLQVADFIAAIGNGGTLYRPQMVEKIVAGDGSVLFQFQPEERGTLPLSPQNLAALQSAMRAVVTNTRGTANFRIRGLEIPVAGKTGTAESNLAGYPHAWFAGYTFAEIEGVPDIAVVVIAEYEGEGSDYGVPIFKRVVETYFYGRARSAYWWEADIGVTKTPTPQGGIPTQP